MPTKKDSQSKSGAGKRIKRGPKSERKHADQNKELPPSAAPHNTPRVSGSTPPAGNNNPLASTQTAPNLFLVKSPPAATRPALMPQAASSGDEGRPVSRLLQEARLYAKIGEAKKKIREVQEFKANCGHMNVHRRERYLNKQDAEERFWTNRMQWLEGELEKLDAARRDRFLARIMPGVVVEALKPFHNAEPNQAREKAANPSEESALLEAIRQNLARQEQIREDNARASSALTFPLSPIIPHEGSQLDQTPTASAKANTVTEPASGSERDEFQRPRKGRSKNTKVQHRRKIIAGIAATGKKGESYIQAVNARLPTPTDWQDENCPRSYLDAYRHTDPKEGRKWRARIWNEKNKAVKALAKNSTRQKS